MLLAVVALSVSSGCGGGGGGTTASGRLLQVGGSYETAVTLIEDNCGGVTVRPAPTDIAHVPGETRFTLSHAALVCAGAVTADASFTTEPVAFQNSLGVSTVRIAGRFSTTGFDADTTVDLVRPAGAPACRYVVHWIGTKQGPPNVLP